MKEGRKPEYPEKTPDDIVVSKNKTKQNKIKQRKNKQKTKQKTNA